MRRPILVVIGLVFGLSVWGCEKKEAAKQQLAKPGGPTETRAADKAKQEVPAGVAIQWLGHASFRIAHGDVVAYIDPWKLKDSPHDATVVLVSHSHHDHYSPDDIAKVSGPDTKLLAPLDVVTKEGKGQAVLPGLRVELPGIVVTGVPAYNPNKKFHPQAQNWLGFVIELGSKRVYYAGDTDLTTEMKALTNIDVALLPVGGTYTMNGAEAANATEYIKPKLAIPCHWGDIVGGRTEADKFAELAKCAVKIPAIGETTSIQQ